MGEHDVPSAEIPNDTQRIEVPFPRLLTHSNLRKGLIGHGNSYPDPSRELERRGRRSKGKQVGILTGTRRSAPRDLPFSFLGKSYSTCSVTGACSYSTCCTLPPPISLFFSITSSRIPVVYIERGSAMLRPGHAGSRR